MFKTCLYSSLSLVLWTFSSLADAKTLKVAAYEHRPYVTQDRAEKGFLYDLTVEAFKAEGYTLDFKFYPPERAKAAVKSGETDVLIPSYKLAADTDTFVYSEPLPGDQVGLVAVKGKHSLKPNQSKPLSDQLDLINGKSVGIVRGAETGTAFDTDGKIKKEPTDRTVLNIDKLMAGRVDYVLADKYEAADSLVSERPQLIGQLEFIDPPISSRAFHISVGTKNPKAKEIIAAFNSGLQKIKKSGRYAEILYSYGQSEQKSDDKTINIATVPNGDMKIMQELSKDFVKANPGVKLNWVTLPENTLRNVIYSSLAISDSQFDVMTIGAFETPIYANKGWLEPLSSLPASYNENDLLTPIKDSLSFNKKLYALPFYGESSMTYYRKDLFDKAGLKMPEKPTYAQIKEFAAKLHNPKDKFYGVCLRGKPGWGENMALLTTMVNSYGGSWFDMKWKNQVGGKGWNEALDVYLDLQKNYGPPDAAENGFGENLKLFAGGNCAMWVDATVAAGMIFDKSQSKVSDKVGFTASPVGTVDKGSHWLWTWALGIPSSSTRKDLATKFIAWATSKDYVELAGKTKGWVSVPPGTRRSTYENAQYKAAAPFAPFVLKAIEEADPINGTVEKKPYLGIQFVNIPEFPAIGTQVGNAVHEALIGKSTAKAALAKAKDATDKIMAKSTYGK